MSWPSEPSAFVKGISSASMVRTLVGNDTSSCHWPFFFVGRWKSVKVQKKAETMLVARTDSLSMLSNWFRKSWRCQDKSSVVFSGFWWGISWAYWAFIGGSIWFHGDLLVWFLVHHTLNQQHTATGSTGCRLWFQVDLVIVGLQASRIWLVPIWWLRTSSIRFLQEFFWTLMFSASQNVKKSLQVDIKQRKRALLLVIWQEWCPAKGYHTIPMSATSKVGIQRSGKRWKTHPTHVIHQLYKRYPQLHMGCKPP